MKNTLTEILELQDKYNFTVVRAHLHILTMSGIGRHLTYPINRISGVMVSMLASSAIDRGFEPQSSQAKDYKIGICCSSAKHAALRSKSKDWLSRNQYKVVSEWSDMSTRRLLFQCASTIIIQLSMLF